MIQSALPNFTAEVVHIVRVECYHHLTQLFDSNRVAMILRHCGERADRTSWHVLHMVE